MSSRILNLFSNRGRRNRSFARIGRRFVRRNDGAAAVEFAIVMVPFIGLTFAIIETALVFFAGQVLETAVADSSRLIMTGQAQKQGFSEAQFKSDLCGRLQALFNCTTGIKIDVKKYAWAAGSDPIAQFAGANMSAPLDGDGNLDTTGFGYQPGAQGDIVVVKVVYEWPTFVRQFGLDLATLPSGKRLLMSTAAFRNEPYTNNP
ncbi:MAG TPA: TadE/TadG family type IV pilus assembly protein [Xanthobacteraceae bacterium]|jgi:Flp pilus assembly protein TadG